MRKILALALFCFALNAAAEDLAVKKMPLVEGRSQAYIYLERGPTTGCPEQVPPNDSTNFWAGGRLTQDGTNIKLCWYRNGSIITILQPRDGNQIRIAESEFSYIDRPAKVPAHRAAPQTSSRSSYQDDADPARKCVVAGMFAEVAATSRDARKPPISVYAKDPPWSELSFAEQKKLIMMVYYLPPFEGVSGLKAGIAVNSMCKHDPDFLKG